MYSNIPFQIIACEGIRNLNNELLTLPNEPNYNRIKSIGIVRDADYNTDAFSSVASALENANNEIDKSGRRKYPIPRKAKEFVGSNSKLAVFIMPDENREGMLENLILDALSTDPIMDCVNQYFECVENLGIVTRPNPLPKATLNVFETAAYYREQTNIFMQAKKVDEASTRKDRKRNLVDNLYDMSWWDWDHSAFDNIKAFITQLVELSDSQ